MNNVNEPKSNWGGSWTIEKLEAFEKYVIAYLTIMLNQRKKYNGWPQNIIYFDGFAGSGDRISENENNNKQDAIQFADLDIQPTETKLYQGSAERVLKLEKKFDEYYFVDIDKDALELLKRKVSTYCHNNCYFITKDVNEALREFSNYLDKQKVALIFLDPFGMQLNWDSIELLKGKRVDLWILLPSGVIINRFLDREGKLQFSHKLQSFFGMNESEIREKFYKTEKEENLFGEKERIIKLNDSISKIAEVYIYKLNKIFKQVTQRPLKLLNSRKVPIYHFIFASNNPAAKKIASQIIESKKR